MTTDSTNDNGTTLGEILDWISTSATRDQMVLISQAMKAREQAVAEEAVADLAIGTKVRLKGLRPKYFNGSTGTITGFNRTTVTVLMDDGVDPRGLRRFGDQPRVPAQCVEVIE